MATNTPRAVVMAKATGYAKEIVPYFSSYSYFNIGTRLARWVSTLIYRVRLVFSDEEALKNVDPDATVVFVMNHRSNMDYILVTYMASSSATLSYAVDDDTRREKNAQLGKDLMGEIASAVPVLPVSLMASVFLKSGVEWLSELEVKSRSFALIEVMEINKAHIYIPHQDRDYAVSAGLCMLTLRHLVKEKDGLYRMNQTESNLLRYYANSIKHFS